MAKQDKLSRREAIKILGTTAGASLLANLPAKWSRPELSGGFVPAHAQTSGCVDSALKIEVIEYINAITPALTVSYYADLPTSNTISGTGFGGGVISWDCATSCDQVIFNFGDIGQSAEITLQVTVLGNPSFDETFSRDYSYSIYLNVSTGIYEDGTFLEGPGFDRIGVTAVDGCPNIIPPP